MKSITHNRHQEDFWDKIALRRTAEGERSDNFPSKKEREKFFRFLRPRKNSLVLEIGAGTGSYTLPLLAKGCFIHATEISAKSLGWLKELAKAKGVLKRLTIEKTSFEDPKNTAKHSSKFDKALMIAVIHHFDPKKRKEIFQNIVTSLKKGGEVIAMEPNPFNPFYYCLYFYRWLFNKQGVNRWSTETGMLYTHVFNLRRLFARCELTEIEVKRYAFFPSAAGKYFPVLLAVNDFLVRIPILKEFCAFIWIKGKRA